MEEFFLSLHVIAIVCWFAGLFYLPRLFVYHAMTKERAVFEQLKVMEYKLYYYIMHPSMLFTLLTGGVLIFNYCSSHVLPALNILNMTSLSFWVFWLKNWLVWKLLGVMLLIIFHIFCGKYLKIFRESKTPSGFRASNQFKKHQFFRIFNEIPTVLLILIIFLAVYKP
jgi:putative membrane protein